MQALEAFSVAIFDALQPPLAASCYDGLPVPLALPGS
jgi:hypothetical protein